MTDAEAVARLETLRRRSRTKLKEGLVKAVMVQAGTFEDKIRRIEMIDLMPEPKPTPPPRKAKGTLLRPPKAPTLPEPEPVADAPLLTEANRVEYHRRRLAKVPSRGGLWRYLTKEFGALVQFAARTSTLSRGLFPFTLKLSAESLTFLSHTLPDQVLPPLSQTLPLVLKKSWLHLNRFEYNLLAGLAQLVRTAASVTVLPEDKTGGGAAWDAVLPGLRLFRTAPGLVDRVLAAWDLATGKLGLPEATRQSGNESIRTLLVERTDALSLPDVLLAVLMLRSRRQLTWEEDQPIEPGEYFLKDGFDCTPDVQAEIDRAVGILSDQLEVLIRESQEVRRIRYFLPAEDLLGEFGGDEREDRAAWALAFLPRLDAAFSPLLEGQVVFANNSQTQLFQNPSLSSILARLRLLASQLADPAQAAQPDLVPSVAKVVMNLGKTLVVLIRNRSLTAHPLARAPSTEQLTDPLPQEESILERPLAWAGLAVIDALVKAARVCLQAGRLLGETSLESSLEKEASLPSRAQEILGRLGRLVPPARLEGLSLRWQSEGSLEKIDVAG